MRRSPGVEARGGADLVGLETDEVSNGCRIFMELEVGCRGRSVYSCEDAVGGVVGNYTSMLFLSIPIELMQMTYCNHVQNRGNGMAQCHTSHASALTTRTLPSPFLLPPNGRLDFL